MTENDSMQGIYTDQDIHSRVYESRMKGRVRVDHNYQKNGLPSINVSNWELSKVDELISKQVD
ncbi:hypothetical protein [Mesorhizobium sp. M0590]|uniref:hypothetical protein n=1 Tax=unclassified Mesorhizobium TaxID=325217 RepID=UPI00333A6162